MIPHHDVAQPDCNSNAACSLDLCAADFDGMIVPEIFFDGRSQPRRHDIEIHGARAEPEPKCSEAGREQNAERQKHKRRSPDPNIATNPTAQPAEPVRNSMKSDAWPIQKPYRPIACRVILMIPRRIIPMPVLIGGLRKGFLGLRTRHCLSVLMVSLAAAGVKASNFKFAPPMAMLPD